MGINQNNYESFFLLYVDNELAAAERLCVEAFVQEHPYLAQELQILKDMILPTEATILGDKSTLYRSASLEENMQEAMLLHLDNELPEAGRKALQHQIEEDKTISAGWELLKKTKLDAHDKITFSHKKSLYRREQSAAVVYGRFTRWAVAAALIAAGFFAGVAIVKNQGLEQAKIATVDVIKSTGTSDQSSQSQNTTSTGKENKPLTAEATFPTEATQDEQVPALAEAVSKNQVNVAGQLKPSGKIEPVDVRLSQKPPVLSAVNNNNQQSVLAEVNQTLKIKKPEREEVSTTLASLPERPNERVEIIDRNLTPAENTYAYSTLMEEPQQNDNHILFMDEEDVARTKAGIFFKKLKRTVTRSTNIKTGNSLKIAGFEFAVK